MDAFYDMKSNKKMITSKMLKLNVSHSLTLLDETNIYVKVTEYYLIFHETLISG